MTTPVTPSPGTGTIKVTEALDDALRRTRAELQQIADGYEDGGSPPGIDPSTAQATEESRTKTREELEGAAKTTTAALQASSKQRDNSDEARTEFDKESPQTTLSSSSGTGNPTLDTLQQVASTAAQQAASAAAQQAAQTQALQQQMMQALQQQQTQARTAAHQQIGQQSYGVSRDEIRKLVREALAAQQSGKPLNGSSTLPDRGRDGTLAKTGVDKLDPSEVSFEKVGSNRPSDAEIAAAVLDAADLAGWPTDTESRERLVNLMVPMSKAESGGNPHAGNGWDSNAVGETQSDGLPRKSSRGSWQTIPDTFAAYHMGGTSNSIYDLTASAGASLNYMIDRYGINDPAKMESFAASRGIDISTGKQNGSYKGY